MKSNYQRLIKAESRVLHKDPCVGGGVQEGGGQVRAKKLWQKSSDASVPVRGSLKLCIPSAWNDWLCKNDCMNNAEAKRFWPALLAPTDVVKQSDNKHTEGLISGRLHPLCATWIVCFCRSLSREGWVSMAVVPSAAPCCSNCSRHHECQCSQPFRNLEARRSVRTHGENWLPVHEKTIGG